MNNEQRIEDIYALLDTTNETNKDVSNQLHSIDNDVTEYGKTIIEIAKNTVANSDGIADNRTRLDSILSNADSIQDEIETVNANIKSIKDYEGLAEDEKVAFTNKLEEVLTNLAENKVDVSDAVRTLSEQYTEKIIALSSKITSIDDALKDGTYETKISQLNENVQSLRTELKDLIAQQDRESLKYSERQVTIINNIQALMTELKAANEVTTTLTNKVDTATTRIGVMEARVDAINK